MQIFEQKKIKYKKTEIKVNKSTTKKIILIPEVKIRINQLRKTKKVCPISG